MAFCDWSGGSPASRRARDPNRKKAETPGEKGTTPARSRNHKLCSAQHDKVALSKYRSSIAQKLKAERDGHAAIGQLAISLSALNHYKIRTCNISASEMATCPCIGTLRGLTFWAKPSEAKNPATPRARD